MEILPVKCNHSVVFLPRFRAYSYNNRVGGGMHTLDLAQRYPTASKQSKHLKVWTIVEIT